MSNIKEHPIVLTAQEVNAVLAGDKTQYRLPVLTSEQFKEGFEWSMGGGGGDNAIFIKGVDIERSKLLVKPFPFGSIGDRLWVKEPSVIHCDWDWFYADNTPVECKEPFTPNDLHLPWDDKHQEYKGAVSAEYLPRWASRILLEITDICIERVRDIDAASAEAEGCFNFSGYERLKPRPLSAFTTYWMAKYGDDAWFKNPWVWVIDFKVIEGVHANG